MYTSIPAFSLQFPTTGGGFGCAPTSNRVLTVILLAVGRMHSHTLFIYTQIENSLKNAISIFSTTPFVGV